MYLFKKKHSLRVYKHALEIYENRGWLKAQDYINFIMSQLNYKLKNTREALDHVEKILQKKRYTKLTPPSAATPSPKHTHHHQKTDLQAVIELANEAQVLKDFITYSNLISSDRPNEDAKKLANIPVPIIDHNRIRVNLNPWQATHLKHGTVLINNDYLIEKTEQLAVAKLTNKNQIRDMWVKFEESLHTAAFHATVSMMFKPQVTLFDANSDNKQMPKVVAEEPVSVLVDLRNNLKTNLHLTNITMLWKCVDQTPGESAEVTNETEPSEVDLSAFVECSVIDELKLVPGESSRVCLLLKPKKASTHLHILGIKYRFGLVDEEKKLHSDYLRGKQLFDIRGARLNNNQQNMRSVVYDTDNRLNLKIIPKMAQLQVKFLYYKD